VRIKEYSRYELKYLLNGAQYRQVVEALSAYLHPDEMGDTHGRYSVTSLYYDSPAYWAYWDKLEGHRFRRKVRARVYGDQVVTPDTPCFVEIKQRINKTVQKKRVVLPYSSAEALCGGLGEGIKNGDLTATEQAIIEEVQYLQQVNQLQPACVVSYDRQAFEGSEYDPGLRVTFDSSLKGRVHDLTLLSQSYAHSYFFLPPEYYVMEVKVNYRVPFWLMQIIGHYGCTLRRVSKYCTALENSKVLLQRQELVY
jgi:hypothetical protein